MAFSWLLQLDFRSAWLPLSSLSVDLASGISGYKMRGDSLERLPFISAPKFGGGTRRWPSALPNASQSDQPFELDLEAEQPEEWRPRGAHLTHAADPVYPETGIPVAPSALRNWAGLARTISCRPIRSPDPPPDTGPLVVLQTLTD